MASNGSVLREFITASADDIVFLRQARDALLTHPRISVDGRALDAAMCRLMTLTAITAIERILEAWKGVPFLERFDADKISNGQKIQLLQQCLADAGVTATQDTLADYLALKYLRNSVAHVRWKAGERQHIESRGFPADLRSLDHLHWKRILEVVWRMLEHLSQAALRTGVPLGDARLNDVVDVAIAVANPDSSRLMSYLLSGPNLEMTWWCNIEKLQEWILRGLVTVEQDVEKLCAIALDSWSRYLDVTVHVSGLNQEAINLSLATLEQLYSLRLYSRAPIGIDLGNLASNREAVRLAIEASGLDSTDAKRIERALQAIAGIKQAMRQRDGQLPIWSEEIPVELAGEVLLLFVALPPELSREDVVRALRTGYQVWRFMRNRAPLDLFLQLASLVPGRRAECLKAGRTALAMLKLRATWYNWVESVKDHPQQPPYELWRHFEQRLQELEAG